MQRHAKADEISESEEKICLVLCWGMESVVELVIREVGGDWRGVERGRCPICSTEDNDIYLLLKNTENQGRIENIFGQLSGY